MNNCVRDGGSLELELPLVSSEFQGTPILVTAQIGLLFLDFHTTSKLHIRKKLCTGRSSQEHIR